MLLGELVAISVASNLFYLAICLSAPPIRSEKSNSPLLAPPGLWLSVFLALITVGISPFTSESTFLPNLLLMHALLFVPLFSKPPTNVTGQNRFSIRIRTLYSLITVFALVLRLRTISSVLSYMPKGQTLRSVAVIVWRILHSHPAQSSIGWDVIWTTVSFFIWTAMSRSKLIQSSFGPKWWPLATATVVTSIGVSAADIWRKDEALEELNSKE